MAIHSKKPCKKILHDQNVKQKSKKNPILNL